MDCVGADRSEAAISKFGCKMPGERCANKIQVNERERLVAGDELPELTTCSDTLGHTPNYMHANASAYLVI